MDIEVLYLVHHNHLRNWLYRRCDDWDVAQDLAATAFLKALSADARGYGCCEAGKEGAWIWEITRNVWRDHARALIAEKRRGGCMAWEDAELIAGQADAVQPCAPELWDVERAIAGHLSAEETEALLLPAQGWRVDEIAERHNRTEAAVKAHLHRTRVKLRETTMLRFQD